MEQKTINFTECDDLQITSHLKEENLPQILQDLLTVAKTTEQKDMLLLSLLTNASYALPRMRAYHGENRHDYGPELMTMVLMGHKLLMHAALMFDLLPDTQPTEVGIVSGSLQQKQFLESLPMSFSKSDAEHLANTLGLSVGTVGNWLTKWVKESKLQHVTYGEYSKIA